MRWPQKRTWRAPIRPTVGSPSCLVPSATGAQLRARLWADSPATVDRARPGALPRALTSILKYSDFQIYHWHLERFQTAVTRGCYSALQGNTSPCPRAAFRSKGCFPGTRHTALKAGDQGEHDSWQFTSGRDLRFLRKLFSKEGSTLESESLMKKGSLEERPLISKKWQT